MGKRNGKRAATKDRSGVDYVAPQGWRLHVMVDGRRRLLGVFDQEETACRVLVAWRRLGAAGVSPDVDDVVHAAELRAEDRDVVRAVLEADPTMARQGHVRYRARVAARANQPASARAPHHRVPEADNDELRSTSISIGVSMLDAIDRVAARDQTNRSALIRRALRFYLDAREMGEDITGVTRR